MDLTHSGNTAQPSVESFGIHGASGKGDGRFGDNYLAAFALDPAKRVGFERITMAELGAASLFTFPDLNLLRPHDDGRIPTSEEYAVGHLKSIIDDLVMLDLQSVFFVSRYSLLKEEPTRRRYVLLKFGINVLHADVPTLVHGFIDARVYNGPMSASILDVLHRLKVRPIARKNLSKLQHARDSPLIFKAMPGFCMYFQSGFSSIGIQAVANTVTGINEVRGPTGIRATSLIELILK